MAKCKLCNKWGLFLKLKNGVCNDCELKIEKEKIEKERLENIQAEERRKREAFLQKKRDEAKAELNDLKEFEIILSSEKRNRNRGYEKIPFSNITPKGKYNEFVVFDVETTGLTPSKDRIIELAAIRFVDGEPIERFETFVNPEREIPADATMINKITNEMVTSAPTISQVIPAFEEFIGKSDLVAHNLEFDLKFLFYSGCNFHETKRKYFDTFGQAKRMLKRPKMKYDKEYDCYEIDYDKDYDVEDYKLGTLCEYYCITIPQQHRAAADAIATGKLFCNLIVEKQCS